MISGSRLGTHCTCHNFSGCPICLVIGCGSISIEGGVGVERWASVVQEEFGCDGDGVKIKGNWNWELGIPGTVVVGGHSGNDDRGWKMADGSWQ